MKKALENSKSPLEKRNTTKRKTLNEKKLLRGFLKVTIQKSALSILTAARMGTAPSINVGTTIPLVVLIQSVKFRETAQMNQPTSHPLTNGSALMFVNIRETLSF
jgi:hypothetical protein